jgi:hypothetical protein
MVGSKNWFQKWFLIFKGLFKKRFDPENENHPLGWQDFLTQEQKTRAREAQYDFDFAIGLLIANGQLRLLKILILQFVLANC